MSFKVCSSAFKDGGYLPAWYSSSGLNASPPFGWAEEPEGTESLSMICSSSQGKVLWVLWNIPNTRKTVYGRLPGKRNLSGGMYQGVNDILGTGWTGPAEKLPGLSLIFTLYALDTVLRISETDVTAALLNSAMKGHILETATISCIYS
jgi:Raf kinase inhibitor-like YbhB/YbcL family protein